MKATVPIWAVTITTKHGHETYLAGTKKEAFDQLDKYVTEWWGSELPTITRPKTLRSRIDSYFRRTEESYNMMSQPVELEIPLTVT